MLKTLRGALCALSLALPLAAPLAGAAFAKDSITVAGPWEVTSVDPAVSGFAYQRMQVMETLVDADVEGQLRPGLATVWQASEDGLSWVFTLRPDVDFHDGSKLTAEAAVAALKRAAENPGPFKKAPLAGIETQGADGVLIKLSSPYSALPAVLAHATTVIPAPSPGDAAGKPKVALGTGPFRVESFNPPQSLDLKRFDGYWGAAPKLETARYVAASRAETRALMAESGDADLVFTLDPSGFARLGDVDRVESRSVPIPRVVLLKVNAGHDFLKETEARKALSLAIDRLGIAAGIVRYPEAEATQFFPPALGAWHDPALPKFGYDPEAAKTLLAELGWTAGDDGILTRDGQRFSLLLRTFPDRPELPLIAAALQDQWRGIGVELQVSIGNYSEIPGGHQDGSLEFGLFARNYGLTPDPIATLLADFGPEGGDWGAMNWQAPAAAKALQQIAATGTSESAKPLIAEVNQALNAELPLIPILWYQHTVAYNKQLKGVAIDPLERSYGLGQIEWAE